MKIRESFEHKYLGFGLHESQCMVHLIDAEKTIIVFEDLSKGTSVTNAIEQLAGEMIALKSIDPDKVKFIEWYPYYDSSAEIEMTYNKLTREYKNPSWSPCEENIINLIKGKSRNLRDNE